MYIYLSFAPTVTSTLVKSGLKKYAKAEGAYVPRVPYTTN